MNNSETAIDLDDIERKPWPFPAAQRVTTPMQAPQHAARRDDEADAFEVLGWHSADKRKPDSDMTVLCWMADGEWFSGWWDAGSGRWLDAASGGTLETVTHWAEPEGPTC